MKRVEEFEGKDLIINTDAEHEFYMELDQAARALEVTEKAIMMHLKRNAAELKEGVHWGSVTICDRQGKEREKRVLYKRGLIRIAMFVRSDPAMRFRQWLEDLVIDLDEGTKFIVNDPGLESLYYMKKQMKQQEQFLDELITQKKRQLELETEVDFIKEDHGNRLETIEKKMEEQTIDGPQSFHIKEIIEDIALALANLDQCAEPEAKHWSHAWGKFKNEFELAKYSHLLKTDYPSAVAFLINWRDKLRERLDHYS